MTVEEIAARVKQIRNASGDDDRASFLEGELFHDVLREVAAGAENPAALATAALKSWRIHFDRCRY